MQTPESISLRPVTSGDAAFLYAVYASTRREELAQVGWDEPQQETFLHRQFEAQRRFYESEYPGADFQLVLAAGQPAGRLYVHRRPDEIRVMDIALLPQYRRGGIGTALLGDILREGDQSGRPVTIHVEAFNPALRLYERLGFRKVATNSVYFLLERPPEAAPSASPPTPAPDFSTRSTPTGLCNPTP